MKNETSAKGSSHRKRSLTAIDRAVEEFTSRLSPGLALRLAKCNDPSEIKRILTEEYERVIAECEREKEGS
jgi:hypothetical protein